MSVKLLLTAIIALLSVLQHSTAAGQAGVPTSGKIAFVRDGNIWIIRPDGTGEKQITFSGRDSSPAWSRDGKKLAFVRYGIAKFGLWVITADGKNARMIVNKQCSAPLWSPRTDELAYIRNDSIDFVDVDGKPTARSALLYEPILHGPSAEALCDWSKDGRYLSVLARGYPFPLGHAMQIDIFERTRQGIARKQTYNQAATAEEKTDCVFHGWSPADPKRILLVKYQSTLQPENSRGGLQVGSDDGANMLALTRVDLGGSHTELPLTAVWSPDGKQIAYENKGAIYILDVEKPEPRLLVKGSSPRWSAQ